MFVLRNQYERTTLENSRKSPVCEYVRSGIPGAALEMLDTINNLPRAEYDHLQQIKHANKPPKKFGVNPYSGPKDHSGKALKKWQKLRKTSITKILNV